MIGRGDTRGVLALCALTSASCFVPGKSGVLAFALDTEDTLLGTTTPLAVAAGSTATVLVAGQRQPVSGATPSDPAVLQVLSVEKDRVVVRALAAGDADLLVRAGERSDAVVVHVATPARWELVPAGLFAVAPARRAAIAGGGRARFGTRAYDAMGAELFSDAPPAFSASPTGGCEALPSAGRAREVVVSAVGPAACTLAPPGGAPIELVPVGDGDVEAIGVHDAIAEAGLSWLTVYVRVGQDELPLIAGDVRLRSRTPEICLVGAETGEPQPVLEAAPPHFAVLSVADGACQIDVEALGRSTSFGKHVRRGAKLPSERRGP